MIRPFHAAIDLGAGSGRVFVGAVDPGNVHLHEAHRFYYAPRRVDGHLRWDVARLFDGLREGLHRASACARDAGGELQSAGVDAWGVDYGLVDEEGSLVEEPICYRDERTAGMMERVFARVPREEIFAATGIQFLALNTLYQLAAHVSEGLPARASASAAHSGSLPSFSVRRRHGRAHQRVDDAAAGRQGRASGRTRCSLVSACRAA